MLGRQAGQIYIYNTQYEMFLINDNGDDNDDANVNDKSGDNVCSAGRQVSEE